MVFFLVYSPKKLLQLLVFPPPRHISQLSERFLGHPAELFDEQDQVTARVLRGLVGAFSMWLMGGGRWMKHVGGLWWFIGVYMGL